jgi:hypothetical protein
MHPIPFFPFSASLRALAWNPTLFNQALRRRWPFAVVSRLYHHRQRGPTSLLPVSFSWREAAIAKATLHQPADDSSLEWYLNASNSKLSFEDKLNLVLQKLGGITNPKKDGGI